MDNIIRCVICGKLITSIHHWNPEVEVKDGDEVNFHQFKSTDAVMCEDCYKKYQKLFERMHNND